jgi:hypothetical protein
MKIPVGYKVKNVKVTRALTAAERKQAERDRNRAAGFDLVQVWVHKSDRARFERVMERINKRRGL